MRQRPLRLIFRRVIRVAVLEDYKIWINNYIHNKDNTLPAIDKNLRIKIRGEIEDKHNLPTNVVLLIQSYV